jgi:hypothetical protein
MPTMNILLIPELMKLVQDKVATAMFKMFNESDIKRAVAFFNICFSISSRLMRFSSSRTLLVLARHKYFIGD